MTGAFQIPGFQADAFQSSPPIAAFTASRTVFEMGGNVRFNNESTGAVTYLWEINDGSGWITFSTEKNPIYEFLFTGIFSIRLTVTNPLGEDTETKTNYIIVTIRQHTGTANVIKSFDISTRINEGLSSFSIVFNTPLSPDEFICGSSFQMSMQDSSIKGEAFGITGIVESVDRDAKNNNRIFKITGRDNGRILTRQPFNWGCAYAGSSEYSTRQILEQILQNTGISIGAGQTELANNIHFSNHPLVEKRFCGNFETKLKAINQLFSQYIKFSDSNYIRWRIDHEAKLRWFEIDTQRAGLTKDFEYENDIREFTVKEEATGILNQFTGHYGDEKDDNSVTVRNEESIEIYGLCVAPTISEKEMTEAQLTAKLNRELNQKCKPIYTATLKLDDFYFIEPGRQIQFPQDPIYDNVLFSVVDWNVNGEPAKPVTTINLTSDESVISVVNEFEVIHDTIKKIVTDNRPAIGVAAEDQGTGNNMRYKLLSGSSSANTIRY